MVVRGLFVSSELNTIKAADCLQSSFSVTCAYTVIYKVDYTFVLTVMLFNVAQYR